MSCGRPWGMGEAAVNRGEGTSFFSMAWRQHIVTSNFPKALWEKS